MYNVLIFVVSLQCKFNEDYYSSFFHPRNNKLNQHKPKKLKNKE